MSLPIYEPLQGREAAHLWWLFLALEARSQSRPKDEKQANTFLADFYPQSMTEERGIIMERMTRTFEKLRTLQPVPFNQLLATVRETGQHLVSGVIADPRWRKEEGFGAFLHVVGNPKTCTLGTNNQMPYCISSKDGKRYFPPQQRGLFHTPSRRAFLEGEKRHTLQRLVPLMQHFHATLDVPCHIYRGSPRNLHYARAQPTECPHSPIIQRTVRVPRR